MGSGAALASGVVPMEGPWPVDPGEADITIDSPAHGCTRILSYVYTREQG